MSVLKQLVTAAVLGFVALVGGVALVVASRAIRGRLGAKGEG